MGDALVRLYKRQQLCNNICSDKLCFYILTCIKAIFSVEIALVCLLTLRVQCHMNVKIAEYTALKRNLKNILTFERKRRASAFFIDAAPLKRVEISLARFFLFRS